MFNVPDAFAEFSAEGPANDGPFSDHLKIEPIELASIANFEMVACCELVPA
jgi:hypothetical protein